LLTTLSKDVANLVVNTDLNMLSVLQYAVEVLNVKHVIVMGHYGCGGVRASMEHTYQGTIDNWIRNIRDVQRLHKDKLDAITDFDEKFRLLVELNVIEQSLNLCKTSVVQKAWKKGINLQIHGWVYDLATGKLLLCLYIIIIIIME
jgi:carbonic anhydrase